MNDNEEKAQKIPSEIMRTKGIRENNHFPSDQSILWDSPNFL